MSSDRELNRVLGPISATCIVIGAIVGVGIFFTPKNVALLVGSGPLALTTWAIGGALALFGALTFAELGGSYPRTGGQYSILRDSYGSPIAFLYVFCNATAIQAGAIAIIAFISAKNLGLAVKGVPIGSSMTVVLSAIMIVGVMVANIVGVRWGAAIQNITVFSKIGTILLITALALFFDPDPPTVEAVAAPPPEPDRHPLSLIFAGLVPVLFSFGGWQQALWIGGEIKDPAKNVPRAIILGVLIVIAVYLSVNWAYLDLLKYEGVAGADALAADAVSRVWPTVGMRFVAIAVAFSAFGVLNAQLLAGPRLVCGMARDGRFFAPFAEISSTRRTPVAAILLLGGIGLLLLAAGEHGVDKVLTGVVLIDSSFFALTGLALIVLRRKRPDAPRPVKVPFYPWIPIAFVVGEIAVVTGAFLDPKYRDGAFIGVLWILGAAICYYYFFRDSRVRTG